MNFNISTYKSRLNVGCWLTNSNINCKHWRISQIRGPNQRSQFTPRRDLWELYRCRSWIDEGVAKGQKYQDSKYFWLFRHLLFLSNLNFRSNLFPFDCINHKTIHIIMRSSLTSCSFLLHLYRLLLLFLFIQVCLWVQLRCQSKSWPNWQSLALDVLAFETLRSRTDTHGLRGKWSHNHLCHDHFEARKDTWVWLINKKSMLFSFLNDWEQKKLRLLR